MSPRAAWRLETLGFSHVYDYVAGKADWTGAGLAIEGTAAATATAGAAADRDAPTCGLDDDIAVVRAATRGGAWDTCVVVNAERVVLGRLGRKAIASDETISVEAAMTAGPTTVRPDTPLEELVAGLRRKGHSTAVVTTSDGRLVGVVRVEAA